MGTCDRFMIVSNTSQYSKNNFLEHGIKRFMPMSNLLMRKDISAGKGKPSLQFLLRVQFPLPQTRIYLDGLCFVQSCLRAESFVNILKDFIVVSVVYPMTYVET